jgi:cation transport ATPase
MLPWRYYNYSVHNNLAWSQTIGLFLRLTWKEDPGNQGLFARHGGTIPCQIDQATCKAVSEKLQREGEWQVDNAILMRSFITSFLNHWPEWITQKTGVMIERWIYEDSPEGYLSAAWAGKNFRHRVYENLLLLMAFLLTPVLIAGCYFARRDDRAEAILLAIMYASTACTMMVTSILFHIEPRYLYPWKAAGFLLLVSSAQLLWRNTRERGAAADYAQVT